LHPFILFLLGVSPREVLDLVASFSTSPSSSIEEIVWIVLKFRGSIGLSFMDRQHLSLGVFVPWLDYNFSMHKVVETVFVIQMSPRSSKLESRFKSFHRFGQNSGSPVWGSLNRLVRFEPNLELGPNQPALGVECFFWHGWLWFVGRLGFMSCFNWRSNRSGLVPSSVSTDDPTDGSGSLSSSTGQATDIPVSSQMASFLSAYKRGLLPQSF
jgi:hypothetical protein